MLVFDAVCEQLVVLIRYKAVVKRDGQWTWWSETRVTALLLHLLKSTLSLYSRNIITFKDDVFLENADAFLGMLMYLMEIVGV